MSTEDIVEVFTDGACRGNPGPGGWGAILRHAGKEKELWGGEPDTTNNRMELTAAIRALEALKRPVAGRIGSNGSGSRATPAIRKTNGPMPSPIAASTN